MCLSLPCVSLDVSGDTKTPRRIPVARGKKNSVRFDTSLLERAKDRIGLCQWRNICHWSSHPIGPPPTPAPLSTSIRVAPPRHATCSLTVLGFKDLNRYLHRIGGIDGLIALSSHPLSLTLANSLKNYYRTVFCAAAAVSSDRWISSEGSLDCSIPDSSCPSSEWIL